MAEDMVAKYNSMALDFQKQSENLLQEITSGFKQAMEASKKNYISLQEGYLKGYNDIVEQAKKANVDMIANMNRNFGDLKASVDNLYKQLQTNTASAFDQSISQFVKQSDEVVKKFPNLTDGPYKEVVKYLKDRYTKTLAEFTKQHKETKDQLEQKFATLVHDLKTPDIPTPDIVKLNLSDDSTDAKSKKK